MTNHFSYTVHPHAKFPFPHIMMVEEDQQITYYGNIYPLSMVVLHQLEEHFDKPHLDIPRINMSSMKIFKHRFAYWGNRFYFKTHEDLMYAKMVIVL